MARKILDRKALRQQAEAAEAASQEEKSKAKSSRKSRPKVKKVVKRIALWGVFSQALVEVQTFDYAHREDAERVARELSESKKVPHFVQLVKREVEVEMPVDEA
ncbi:MAG: hypothetical protein H5U08_01910 [Thermogutta sp.]|uniref:hypothetical protein n=1 Tax=Thermogutta sp. TaxID=1962930 RepID=UPI0019AE0FE3|nr:hypothetical protein [Thermogutta sp.]MBC7351088.1 hypothetical protein [Thermogutta sp.]GIX01743.1 MAG: hypothetical protein KatS3mg112_0680 [Thermogutta sp.]